VSGDAGGAGAGGASTSGGSSAGGGSTLVRCPEGTNPKSDPNPTEVGTVIGQITDEHDMPTSAGLVQICGKDLCINARVGDDGKLAEQVDQMLEDPACKYGDGLSWGKLAVPLALGLEGPPGETVMGPLMTVALPDFANSAAFTPGQPSTSGGVTLTLAEDAHVDVDTLTYEDASQQGFRAAALPAQALQPLQQNFVAGWALSPIETRICPSPSLSIENTGELAVGTQLELYILGLDVAETWAPYGDWQKVGEGQVSDDGKTLDFPDGLPLLTAIGIKVKG
jgi:hypothetical protein